MAKRAKQLNERIWIRQVMDKYEAVEKLEPTVFVPMEAPPEWAYRAVMPIVGLSHPKLNRNAIRKWTARDLGYFLGRQSALDHVMWGEVPMNENLVMETIKSCDTQETTFGLNSNPRWVRAKKQLTARMRKWRVAFRQFVDEALLAARERPYPESSAFLKAFGAAAVIGDDDFDNRKLGVGERIAWVMFLFWRPISTFESTGQLHRFLSAVLKPMGIFVTLKRIEKLCHRIGLKFKGPGRPRKSIIKTGAPLTA